MKVKFPVLIAGVLIAVLLYFGLKPKLQTSTLEEITSIPSATVVIQPTFTPTDIPPTKTPFPTFTATAIPSPTPTVTALPSPSPTATRLPASISGKLFFDIDVSGTQNEIRMKYFDGLIHPGFRPQTQNPDFVSALEAYAASHPKTRDHTYITLMEPGLSNIEVCASVKDVRIACVLTDDQGFFSITGTAIQQGDFVGLDFSDKNESLAPKMAYQNRFVRAVNIPAYEIDGVKVPEQNLAQTHLMKITNTYYVTAGESDITIGLLQGALPYPPLLGEPYIFSFFDHDPRLAWGLDWRGRTALIPKSYNQLPNKLTDGLDGVDIGGQKGDFVISLGFGMATARRSEKMGNQIVVMIDNFPQNITYNHLDKVLISGTQEVFAGQIIGIVGRTGKDVGAPHVHLDVGTSGYDPFGDPKGAYPQLWSRAFSLYEFP